MSDLPHPNSEVSNTRVIAELMDRSADAFGKSVRLGTTNEADLAAHYDYSPERYRIFVDGTRQFVEYDGSPAQFTDNADSFSLLPQSDGETVRFETAEKYRYVVQYVIEWSLAFQLNQELNSGDVWSVGYGYADLENSGNDTPGPSADGWIVWQNSSNDTNTVRLSEYRDGTEVDGQDVTLTELPQVWGRLAGNTNWYNVGETNLEETYTAQENGVTVQKNDPVGTVANDTGKGPLSGNQHVTAEVKTGATSAGSLELEVGSIGVRTLGDVTAINRLKTFSYNENIDTTGSWIPVLAIRGDPDRGNVNMQFDALEVLEFTGSDDAFGLIQAFDETKVADTNGNPLQDGNYSTPSEFSSMNSVIQINTNVEQVADQNGTLQTSMTDPGGYQLGFGSLYSSGSGFFAQREKRAQLVQKRNLSNGDVGVLMVKSPSTGNIKGQISTGQDW